MGEIMAHHTPLNPFYAWVVAEYERLNRERLKLATRANELYLVANTPGFDVQAEKDYADICVELITVYFDMQTFEKCVVAAGGECPDSLPSGAPEWALLWTRYHSLSLSESLTSVATNADAASSSLLT